MPAGGREKMRYIVNSREMNLYDSRTIEEFHMPQAVLMERAAFSFVETLRREKRNTSRTLVVCGSGNNGGDGYAIARILMQAGNTVDVLEERPSAISSRRRSFLRTAVRSSRNFRRGSPTRS